MTDSFSMSDANLSSQIEEIEALSSIYGNEWQTLDVNNRTYSIDISCTKNASAKKITLQVSYPLDYPSSAPPTYQLHAPWLRGELRDELTRLFDQDYLDNIGESVTYQWVETVREFLRRHYSEDSDSSVPVSEEVTSPSLMATVSQTSVTTNQTADKCGIKIVSGDFITDRKSRFQGHIASVGSKQEAMMVLDKLKEDKRIAEATHNIYAYRIVQRHSATPLYITDCADDGEIHAGSRLLHLLEIVDAENVIVVVSRWYGGIHLGTDRFKHINKCARDLLELQGYIKDSQESKKAKKGKK